MIFAKKRLVCILFVFAAAFAAAEDYSIDAYLKRVEQFSKDLEISRKNLEQADIAVNQAYGNLLPSVTLVGDYKRNVWDIEQPTPIGASTTPQGSVYPLIAPEMDSNMDNELTLAVQAQMVLFNKKALSGVKYGKEYLNLSGVALEEARKSIMIGAKKVYYGTVLARELLSVKESTEKNNRAVYENMKQRYEVGLAQELEMLRAEVTWQNSIPEVTQATKNLENALIQMKTLAGIELGQDISLTTSLSDFPALPDEVKPESSYNRRADYALLRHQRELADISLDLAEADFYPTVTGSVSLARQGYGDGSKFMDSKFNALVLGVTVALPVFNGGTHWAQIQSERANLVKHDLELAKKRDVIQAEITSLYLSLREAWQRIESSQKTLATAENAYRLSRLSLENGLLTQIELNASQEQLEQTQLLYYSSVYEYLALYFEWEKALGL